MESARRAYDFRRDRQYLIAHQSAEVASESVYDPNPDNEDQISRQRALKTGRYTSFRSLHQPAYHKPVLNQISRIQSKLSRYLLKMGPDVTTRESPQSTYWSSARAVPGTGRRHEISQNHQIQTKLVGSAERILKPISSFSESQPGVNPFLAWRNCDRMSR